MSGFTPFLWVNPDRGNRSDNLKAVTGFTQSDGYLRFPRKFEGVFFGWRNFHRLLVENGDPDAHAGHHFLAHHKDGNRWNNVYEKFAFMDRPDHVWTCGYHGCCGPNVAPVRMYNSKKLIQEKLN